MTCIPWITGQPDVWLHVLLQQQPDLRVNAVILLGLHDAPCSSLRWKARDPAHPEYLPLFDFFLFPARAGLAGFLERAYVA